MTRDDIELLFQSESYDEAMRLLRKELQEDSENAEWYYYLFLAENGDYANINFEDVVCEFDFNRALDLANARLRDLFLAEYNFYKAVNPNLRKYFAYASRGNINKFEELLDTYGNKATKLIHDSSNIEDFFSNLDYLVTFRVKHEIVDLNILALNLLYLATRNDRVYEIYKLLKARAKEIGTVLANIHLSNYLSEIKACLDTIKAKRDISIEVKKSLEKPQQAKSLNSKEYELKRQKEIEANKKAFFQQPEVKENKPIQPTPINRNWSNAKTGYFRLGGFPLKYLSLTLFIVSMLILGFSLRKYLDGTGMPVLVLILLNILVFILNIPLCRSTDIALSSENKKKNGGYPSLVFNMLTVIYSAIGSIWGIVSLIQNGFLY